MSCRLNVTNYAGKDKPVGTVATTNSILAMVDIVIIAANFKSSSLALAFEKHDLEERMNTWEDIVLP